MSGHILVIDQGTTSTRAIVFGPDAEPVAMAQREFAQLFPQPGWVEHDPEDIWRTTLETAREALDKAGAAAASIAGMGIANQRETALVWNRSTGRVLHNAIVWQDRRTADTCAQLKLQNLESEVTQRTGLLIDPYFSAAKIAWMLEHVEGARDQARRGELAFGTVDSFLLWRFTNGKVHATDATNASRTSLLNIHTGQWDEELLRIFGVPASMMPEVRDCACEFGRASSEHFGLELPILGVAGDQQAALIGQACFQPGMTKSTYGTGGFILRNIGVTAIASRHRLLTTIAYQWAGKRTYALEGSIFSAGATVQWLRDGLGVIASASESGALAAAADPEQRVYFVPAFTGLGAPHWNSEARGAILGLTRGSTRREIVRAALESVGYQTRDLVAAMQSDEAEQSRTSSSSVIRIDGGMSASDWTMQFLADMLDAPVDRPHVVETTALGAAYLAGWKASLYPGPDAFARGWRAERRFTPLMAKSERQRRYEGWADAVSRATAPNRESSP